MYLYSGISSLGRRVPGCLNLEEDDSKSGISKTWGYDITMNISDEI